MDPPMVLVSLDRNSELLGIIREVGEFGVNVLSRHQAHTAVRFATKGGTAKFDGVHWHAGAGVPRLPGCCFLLCTVAAAGRRRGSHYRARRSRGRRQHSRGSADVPQQNLLYACRPATTRTPVQPSRRSHVFRAVRATDPSGLACAVGPRLLAAVLQAVPDIRATPLRWPWVLVKGACRA